MFEVQVQGKFKRKPAGEIFVGAESSEKMQLGLITRSISKIVCNFCSTIVADLHYSFGDSTKDGSNYQLPHLVAPLFPTLDKIIVTPPGESPPTLGTPFTEDPDYRKQRLKFHLTADANIDLETTYSFSVNTSNLNLADWKIVGVPMVQPMDLRSFFSDASIMLVAYELPRTPSGGIPPEHHQSQLNYVFKIKLSAIDGSLVADSADVLSDDTDEAYDPDPAPHNMHKPILELPNNDEILSEEEEEVEAIDFNDDDGEEEDKPGLKGEFSAGLQKKPHFRRINPADPNRQTMGSWLRRRIDDITPDSLDVPETQDYVHVDYELEGHGDLRYCPMALEVNDYRIMRERRRTLYLVPWTEPAGTTGTGNSLNFIARLKSYSELTKIFPMVPIPKYHKNKKLSSEEKKRRHVVESYRALLSKGRAPAIASAKALLVGATDADRSFLDDRGRSHSSERSEGSVAMASSSRHWSEQFMRVSRSDITFVRGVEMKRVWLRIPAGAVFCVRSLRPEECPLPSGAHPQSVGSGPGATSMGFAFFLIETFARVFYIMVREKQLNDWISTFLSFYGPTVVQLPQSPNAFVYQTNFPESADAYFVKIPTWKLDKRRIFNYRRIVFNTNGIPDSVRLMPPQDLVTEVLSQAFALATKEALGHSDSLQWVTFLDWMAYLQTINISSLTEKERVAVLLNLYHLMTVHVSLVIGPPQAWSSWQAFFSSSYILSFDIVSIAEIEHNMLRACMSRPSLLVSKLAAPNSQYPGLALTQRDFRLNFCINNSSRSMPQSVPIYHPETLDRQLDESTIAMLAENFQIDSSRRLVILPKVCSWYPHDFSSRRQSAAFPTDCLRVIAPYLKTEHKVILTRLLSDGANPSVKFKNYNFRCRLLSQRKPSIAATVLIAQNDDVSSGIRRNSLVDEN